MAERGENDNIPIVQLIRKTGCSRSCIDSLVHLGKIRRVGNCIHVEDAEKIIRERSEYIGLVEYAGMHITATFNGKLSTERERLLDYLEKASFYGADVISPDQILTGNSRDRVYFRREEIPILNSGLKDFFLDYGMTEEEKVERLLAKSDKIVTVRMFRDYVHTNMFGANITPSFTECVRLILSTDKEVSDFNDKDIGCIIKSTKICATKEHIIGFLNYFRQKLGSNKVSYYEIKRNKGKSQGLPAYDNETYLQLLECFFSPEHIEDNHMIEKALNNHIYAEMWLYLALFICCGARAADVARIWQYPELNRRDGQFLGFLFNKDNLREDILYNRIPDNVYQRICRYSLGMVDLTGRIPSKTATNRPPVIKVLLSEKCLAFFGLLTLICEVHNMSTGEGYMRENRVFTYQNKAKLKAFFGPRIMEILDGQNIRSCRLTKVLLQGVEHTGRKMGMGGILCATLASYMRAHADHNTIRIYLRDQNLTGETADFVIYCMMDRGVFGFQYYQTLLTAYPEAMNKLSMEEQSRIIEMMNVTPMQLELTQSSALTQYDMQSAIKSGNKDSALRVLKRMYEITQGRGNAKDNGVYCLLRAENLACGQPDWESCLANGCSNLILTRYGIIPLIAVIKDYKKRADAGDKKAEAVLHQVIIPRYKDFISTFMKDTNMTPEERKGIRLIQREEMKNG